jgi:uncharacterized membrane protein
MDSLSKSQDLPFIAVATILAMLAGFVLVVLLPYNVLIGWAIFLVIESVICLVIIGRLVRVRRKLPR